MDEPFAAGSRPVDRRRTQLRLLAGLGLGAFLLGGVATWLLAGSPGLSALDLFEVRRGEPVAVPPGPDPVTAPSPAASEELPAAVRQVAEQQGGLDQRVAAMEQRLSQLDLQTQAAAGNAARAEGLLVAFAARRAIERGAPLGYLADQLRLRFGEARPRAVQIVIDAAQDPVTLDQLIARLDGLAPQLQQAPQREGAISWLSRELSELFVVRREDSPSPAPERRLERARLFLETGRTEAAVSEVQNLPNAAGAADWIRDANRYAAAQRALELIETTASLEPRQLRDGAGRSVEQPSPIARD